MSRQKFKKDPQAGPIDYNVDWTEWLVEGDFLASSTWTIETIAGDTSPLAEVAPPSGPPFDAFKATIWVEAGMRGKTYTVTNRITTDRGRSDERSI